MVHSPLLFVTTHLPYTICFLLVAVGIFALVHYNNLFKKLLGLVVIYSATILFNMAFSYQQGASAPILNTTSTLYSNGLSQTISLLALLVFFVFFTFGLVLLTRIKRAFGTLEESEILLMQQHSTAASLQQHKRLEAAIVTKQKQDKKNHKKPKALRKLKMGNGKR